MISDPYFNHERCVERLFKDYCTHNSLIVAFDFDNTIFDYHNVGYQFNEVIRILKECEKLGFTLILFTSNDGEKLKKAIKYCRKAGINNLYVNVSPLNKNQIKPYYNILLDDRAGLKESFEILKDTIKLIRRK